MKTTFLTLSFFLCLFTNICAQTTTTLIFKDHSGSIQPSADQVKTEAMILKTILLKTVKQKGDRIIISYLYRNTNSVSNTKELVFDPSIGNTDATDKLAQARAKSQLMKAKFGFINRVGQTLWTDEMKSDQTRILEALPKIGSYLKEGGNVHVVFLSDMLESSPRRELLSIRSKEGAEAKAKQDVSQIMTDFDLTASSYPHLTIDCYLPLVMMERTQALQFVPYYWKTVFSHLFGTQNLKFHTL